LGWSRQARRDRQLSQLSDKGEMASRNKRRLRERVATEKSRRLRQQEETNEAREERETEKNQRPSSSSGSP
jgi:hypothetical protein